jgi:hypothetical protein
MVMVTSADREMTVLLPVMVVWHGEVARRAVWRYSILGVVFNST